MCTEPLSIRSFIAQGTHDVPAYASNDRAGQLFEIARLLGQLGLAAWTHPLLTLLDTYSELDGLAPSDDPVPAVRSLLLQYQLDRGAPTGGKVADDLSSLQVMFYGAAWYTSSSEIPVLVWNPLQMTFREFRALHFPRGHWKAWKAAVINPDQAEVRRHLLANYVKVNGFL